MFKRQSIKTIALLLLILPIATAQAKVRYLFSHGLFNTGKKQAHKYIKTYKIDYETTYINKRYIIDGPVTFFNYPDAVTKGIMNITKANIAQDNDVAHLKSEVEKTIQNNQEKELILFGVSRGASTALNFMALHDDSAVKALIVESPFDAMATVVDNMRKQLHLEWLSHDFGQCLLENIFWQYKRDAKDPIDLVSNIRKDLPILIICSKEDFQVPWHSSEQLYQKLKESGHDNVHLLVVPKGAHAHIITGKSGDIYQAGTHAFCAKYGFPHDPELAKQGEKYLC